MTAVFKVRQVGPFVSVQDGGRRGYQRFGVTESGAMDRLSFALANAALDRPVGSAALEVSLGGLELECINGSITAAVAGGHFSISIDDQRYPSFSAFSLHAGTVLKIRPGDWGSWCYLSFAGHLQSPEWLGSQSVLLNLGLCGRPLVAGDLLEIADSQVQPQYEGVFLAAEQLRPDTALRVVLGPQDQYFESASIDALFTEPFELTADYNRQGVRLKGPSLKMGDSLDIPSEPIARGSLQVPGHGDPILLMADHQTTGGYPKIATVISVDQDKFAQLRTGDQVTFRQFDVADAIRASRKEHERRLSIHESAALNRVSLEERLANSNLISGVSDGSVLD